MSMKDDDILRPWSVTLPPAREPPYPVPRTPYPVAPSSTPDIALTIYISYPNPRVEGARRPHGSPCHRVRWVRG